MTLHAFTIAGNSIVFKFFVGDENTVQKFEGELFQLVIFSYFVYIIYTFFPIVCNHFIFFLTMFFLRLVTCLFFQGIIGSSPCIAFWEGLTLCLLKAETNYHPVRKVVV